MQIDGHLKWINVLPKFVNIANKTGKRLIHCEDFS